MQNLPTTVSELADKLFGIVYEPGIWLQLGTIIIILLAARMLGALFRRSLRRWLPGLIPKEAHLSLIEDILTKIASPLTAAVLLWIAFLLAQQNQWDHILLGTAMKLAWAWMFIRLMTSFLAGKIWAKILAVFIWTVVALDIVGVLRPTIDFLDQIGLGTGGNRLSIWVILKAAIMLAIIIPLVGKLSSFLQAKIEKAPQLTPKLQVLLSKLLKTALYSATILIALDSVGFNFQLLALFSGAVGLGVGFGLQKVVSNLVSGVIILADNSIRPGDVIEVGGVYGWIESLHARFVSVVTRDGTSFLIPNDDLITNQVINWSFSGHGTRLKIPVGVSYSSDVPRAMELMVAAAEESPRVLKQPAPVARLIGFGDSSIDLELRVWIKDPQKGVVNIKSEIQLKIWEIFREHGVEFPFPQRDLSLKPTSEITVRLQGDADIKERGELLPAKPTPPIP
ncbi:MAG: mechanosensitive ion channel family protein [Desulfobacteraceae bacterium]